MTRRLHRRSRPAAARSATRFAARITLLPVLLALTILAASTARADSMRCGTRLVADGASRAEVAARCGTPTDVSRHTILRPAIYWRHGRPMSLAGDDLVIPVEIWLYNLGPDRLMRRLQFEAGALVAIETLGYGYLDPAASDRSAR